MTTQQTTDAWTPRDDLNRTVLLGCVHTGRQRRVLDDQDVDYRHDEGRGAAIAGLVGMCVPLLGAGYLVWHVVRAVWS